MSAKFHTSIYNTMEKIKNFFRWIGMDGLLHFLSCYSLMSLALLVGIWWALLVTVLLAAVKEAYDYFIQKDNDVKSVRHDIIFDILGIVASLIMLLV